MSDGAEDPVEFMTSYPDPEHEAYQAGIEALRKLEAASPDPEHDSGLSFDDKISASKTAATARRMRALEMAHQDRDWRAHEETSATLQRAEKYLAWLEGHEGE